MNSEVISQPAFKTPEDVYKLLAEMPDAVVVKAPFRNNDVPKFLEKLRRYEEASSQVVIMIGGSVI